MSTRAVNFNRRLLTFDFGFETLSPTTLIEALRDSLFQAARHNPNDAVPPAAILWANEDRQWEPLIPQLRRLVPALLSYGTYDPKTQTGPVIWLRGVIERALPEVDIPKGTIPVIYLPGIGVKGARFDFF